MNSHALARASTPAPRPRRSTLVEKVRPRRAAVPRSWRSTFFGSPSPPEDDDDTGPSSSTRTLPNGTVSSSPSGPSAVAGAVAGGVAGGAARLVDGATAAAAKLESFRLPELDEESVGMLKDIADPATFGRRGEWLVVLQFTALFFVLFPPHAVSVAVQLAGLCAAAGGLLLIVGGATSLGARSLSPFPTPRPTNVLTTSGAYALVRHPMYAGLLALAGGLTAVSVNPGRLLATACLAAVLREKVRVEEGALAAVHGPAYEVYRERVKKIVPFIY